MVTRRVSRKQRSNGRFLMSEEASTEAPSLTFRVTNGADGSQMLACAGQETRTSAPSMAFNQPGESPGLGNVTAQYPKVVTA